jgi:hypothetical protein
MLGATVTMGPECSYREKQNDPRGLPRLAQVPGSIADRKRAVGQAQAALPRAEAAAPVWDSERVCRVRTWK